MTQKIKVPILVVDDKEFMINVIRDYILSNPVNWFNGIEVEYDIVAVQDGKEAILQYAKYNYPIVIMDLHMPKLNGLIAVESILEINSTARIIGMASHGESLVEEFKESGIRMFLEKPFQNAYLWSRMNELMEEIIVSVPLEEFDCRKKKKSIWKKLISK